MPETSIQRLKQPLSSRQQASLCGLANKHLPLIEAFRPLLIQLVLPWIEAPGISNLNSDGSVGGRLSDMRPTRTLQPRTVVVAILQEGQDGQSWLSVSSIRLLGDCSMPSPLHQKLHSKHPGQSWQVTLKRWLQAFPANPHPMPMARAMSVVRTKSELHAAKPVDKIQQKLQQGLMLSTLSGGTRLKSAYVSHLPVSFRQFLHAAAWDQPSMRSASGSMRTANHCPGSCCIPINFRSHYAY